MATDRKDCYVTGEDVFESEYANSRLRITLETLSRRPDGSVMPGFYGRFIKLECQSTSVDKYFILDRPAVDFELLFGYGALNYSQEHGDLPLITAKSSIYSTRQHGNFMRVNVDHSNYLRLFLLIS
ncbi:hypothetical protein [Serratia fonticola]